MAALTGQERGLPPGSYLNDTIDEGPDVAQVSVVWQPYEDEVSRALYLSPRSLLPTCQPNNRWSEGAPAYSLVPLISCRVESFLPRGLSAFCRTSRRRCIPQQGGQLSVIFGSFSART